MSESESAVDAELKSDMETVAEVADNLVINDAAFGQLVASMLASRQLYAMCMYELEWLLQEGEAAVKQVSALSERQKLMLKEVLINAAAVQAQQPFDENVLFQGMKKIVFPWMEKVVGKHSDHQSRENKRLFEEREKVRVETRIDLGLGVSEAPLARQTPVLLVGETYLLRFLFTRLVENLPDTVKQVVQLVENNPNTHAAEPCLVSVPPAAWKGCARSNNGFQKVYENCVRSALVNPVDLLLVHNLLPAYTDMEFAAITTRANEAQHRFKKWANAAGALLVGGLPLDRPLKANELHQPEYETLRLHNVLRGVMAKPLPDSDDVEILVGPTVAFRVSKVELDTHKGEDSD